MKAIGLWLGLALVIAASLPSGAGEQRASKPGMVIQVGWTSPDTQYLRLHAKEMERIPFTGVVSYVSWPRHPGGGVENSSGECNLGWLVFQEGSFSPDMIAGAQDDLQSTKFCRFTDNLLWINSYRSNGQPFDWFDEPHWKEVCRKAETLARLARTGGYRGIFFDAEEYGCPFWSWGESRPEFELRTRDIYKGKAYEEVRDKVRSRGREFIKAVNRGFPGCLFWTTYAYSHIVKGILDGDKDLSDNTNSLYMAFIDGILEASDDKTVLVDGCEGSYRFSEIEEFMSLRKVAAEKALAFTQVPDIYRRKVRVGFGLYLDMYNYPSSHSWYSDPPDDNYMTPVRLEKAVRNALESGDGYVWIYSEYPSWWLGRGETSFGEGVRSRGDHKSISPVYWRAIGRARAVGG